MFDVKCFDQNYTNFGQFNIRNKLACVKLYVTGLRSQLFYYYVMHVTYRYEALKALKYVRAQYNFKKCQF